MKRILTALVLIPLVLVAVFRAPLWLFLLLVVVVALGALSAVSYTHLDVYKRQYPVRDQSARSQSKAGSIFLTETHFVAC